MIGSSVITYGIVRTVEKKLFNIEKTDAFLENILGIRMIEMNFFLYKDQQTIAKWAAHLQTATHHLNENEQLFIRLSSPSEINAVRNALNSYTTTFNEFQQHQPHTALIAAEIRTHGDQLTTLAEELIVREHQTIHHLLGLIRNSLILMLPLLVLLFSSIAALLGRGIVSSLKQLEQHAATIATGNFIEAPFTSTSREINSLINGFNQMSRELKARQQQLVRSEKLASLGTMLAGVAHEFNNPLSNISSSAQILAEELGDHDDFSQELLTQITTETSRASAIIKTLLSLAREEKFHRDHYPLKPLLQEILDLLHGQVSKDIEIQLAIAEDLLIFADKQKIQQVFINLLNNSCDALNGTGKIKIRAWQNQAGLKISISDTGPGIPRQLHGKIFDPFFTTKDTGQGSGLGLFIIHDIIVQHGGSINIDNMGQGAVFTIILPAKEASCLT
ncbi:MAG: ATP-binding protein [Desulfobulbaceae bacterium]|jgi:two-component system NtrC family sensor kinase|nr:ATP-binding protein [Desulfobulbaceae bacterium]